MTGGETKRENFSSRACFGLSGSAVISSHFLKRSDPVEQEEAAAQGCFWLAAVRLPRWQVCGTQEDSWEAHADLKHASSVLGPLLDK